MEDEVEDSIDVDVLVDGVASEGDGGEEAVEDKEDGWGEAGVRVGEVPGPPVAVAICVISRFVVAGAPMLGGSAEEKASEPGVSWEVAIGITVRKPWVGLIA